MLKMIPFLLIAMFITGCSDRGQVMDGDGMFQKIEYTQITQEEAKQMSSDDEKYDMTPMPIVFVRVGDNAFTVDLEDNSSAEAFFEKINGDGLTVDMHDYGGFEKVGDLPWELPANDEEITTKPGDIILYQGNKITIYYGENTWNFTKLGELRGGTEEDIAEWKEAFGGKDDITAEFMVEWTE